MSNCCDYVARLQGTRQGVTDLLWWLFDCGPLVYKDKERKWSDEEKKWKIVPCEPSYNSGYVGRIGHSNTDIVVKKDEEDDMMVEISDWCAWSFETAACTDGEKDNPMQKSIPFLCRVYDVKFEVFREKTARALTNIFISMEPIRTETTPTTSTTIRWRSKCRMTDGTAMMKTTLCGSW